MVSLRNPKSIDSIIAHGRFDGDVTTYIFPITDFSPSSKYKKASDDLKVTVRVGMSSCRPMGTNFNLDFDHYL